MADDRRFELDDLLVRPGTYFNPQTEVLVVVDDSPSIDGEIFNMEEFEGADWVLISDDVPVDEARRDELLETSRRPTTAATAATCRDARPSTTPTTTSRRRGRRASRPRSQPVRGPTRRLPRPCARSTVLGVFIPVAVALELARRRRPC